MAQSFFIAFAELITIMFTKTPLWVRWWVGLLMMGNVAGPLYYYESNPLVASVIFGVFNVGAIVMTLLKANYGYTKLLGAGHVFWIPLVPWILFTQLDESNNDNYAWLVSVIVMNTMSLYMDIKDVWSYYKGNRSQAFVGAELFYGGKVKAV